MMTLKNKSQRLCQYMSKIIQKIQILLKQHQSMRNKNQLSSRLQKFVGQLVRDNRQCGTRSMSQKLMLYTVF